MAAYRDNHPAAGDNHRGQPGTEVEPGDPALEEEPPLAGGSGALAGLAGEGDDLREGIGVRGAGADVVRFHGRSEGLEILLVVMGHRGLD